MAANATVLRNRLLLRARLRNIQVFVRTAELGSVRLAAEAAGMAQPSATQSLAELESLLQCALFLRHSRGMTLTVVGRALLPTARRLLDIVDEGADQVAALQGSQSGMVRVTAIAAAIHGLLLKALPLFSCEHPDVVVRLEEMDGNRQIALLADGEQDLCLCRQLETLPAGWEFQPLLPDRFAIVCDPRHPLIRKRSVPLEDLAKEKWLTVPMPLAARRSLDRLFENEPHFPVVHSVVTTAPALIKGLLGAERLLALMPFRLFQHEIQTGQLAEIPLPANLPLLDIGMLLPKAEHDMALLKLSSFLRAYAAVPSGA